jgi:hypothetical protein
MKPALFVFADAHSKSCVYVYQSDHKKAYSMIVRTITHEWMTKVEDFDASEMSTLFVAANKSGPFDMIAVGDFDESDEYEDVGAAYEVSPSKDGRAVVVIAATPDEEPQQVWLLKKVTFH